MAVAKLAQRVHLRLEVVIGDGRQPLLKLIEQGRACGRCIKAGGVQ